MSKREKKDNYSNNRLKKFFLSIDWDNTLHGLAFILIVAVIVSSAWLVLSNINHNVYSDEGEIYDVKGKIIINVSVSDTLTRDMDEKLNLVLQELLQIKQDSLAVEVRKVHYQQ